MSGRFIVIEGIDGCGKTTLCSRLAEALRADGKSVFPTYEPTHSAIGKLARMAFEPTKVPMTAERWARQELLLAADRMNHVITEVSATDSHDVVLCDRYVSSGYAYGLGSRPESVSYGTALAFLNSAYTFVRKPDYTLLLDVRPEQAVERMVGRKVKSAYDVDLQLLHSVRKEFVTRAQRDGWGVVEGDGVGADEVAARALVLLRAHAGL